jgi:hypothetical protein
MDPAVVADEDELEKFIRSYLPFLFSSNHPDWPWESMREKVPDYNG